MSTLAIRICLPTHERMKSLAKSTTIHINKLMDESSTVALAGCDTDVRCQMRLARGNRKRALAPPGKPYRAS